MPGQRNKPTYLELILQTILFYYKKKKLKINGQSKKSKSGFTKMKI